MCLVEFPGVFFICIQCTRRVFVPPLMTLKMLRIRGNQIQRGSFVWGPFHMGNFVSHTGLQKKIYHTKSRGQLELKVQPEACARLGASVEFTIAVSMLFLGTRAQVLLRKFYCLWQVHLPENWSS